MEFPVKDKSVITGELSNEEAGQILSMMQDLIGHNTMYTGTIIGVKKSDMEKAIAGGDNALHYLAKYISLHSNIKATIKIEIDGPVKSLPNQ